MPSWKPKTPLVTQVHHWRTIANVNERKSTPTEMFAFVHIYDAIWWCEVYVYYIRYRKSWMIKWFFFDCPCWSVKSRESMSLLSLSPAFSNSSARNRSSPPKLTQRLVPSPDSWSFPSFQGPGVWPNFWHPQWLFPEKILLQSIQSYSKVPIM